MASIIVHLQDHPHSRWWWNRPTLNQMRNTRQRWSSNQSQDYKADIRKTMGKPHNHSVSHCLATRRRLRKCLQPNATKNESPCLSHQQRLWSPSIKHAWILLRRICLSACQQSTRVCVLVWLKRRTSFVSQSEHERRRGGTSKLRYRWTCRIRN